MRTWIKAAGTLVVVTATGLALDDLLRKAGVSRRDLLFLSDFLVGCVAAGLVWVVVLFNEQKNRFITGRLKVIAEMNHHIRNALQVISFYSWTAQNEKEVASIKEAVKRITWALSEVLPQMPTSVAMPEAELPPSPAGAGVYHNSGSQSGGS
ncbi:MAG: hypothetical protein LAO78_18315 [Acidobacteriia bacterium]|nr:hypothetical protein [Terriglobia bacterium]